MLIGIASADYMRADRTPDGVEKWGGAGWARLGQYIPYIEAAGHVTIVGTLWQRDGALCVERADGTADFPDVVILQRIMHGGVHKSIKYGQSVGQIVVNDLDDWYWGLDPSNDAFKASHPKENEIENTSHFRRNLGASDHIITSTPYLGERLRQMFKNQVPVHLLPNTVEVDRFTPVDHDVETPVLGWAGSTSHRSGDIEQVRGVYGGLLREGSIKMRHAGDAISSPKFADKIGLPIDMVERVPRKTTDEYPSLLDFHIGMVPLRQTPFNDAKSAIKGLEYASSGIPFMASPSSAYRELHNDWAGEGFFLCKKATDWQRSTRRLMDASLRKDMADCLLSNVRAYDIEHGAKRLVEFLESL